jgi:hypothetical protein
MGHYEIVQLSLNFMCLQEKFTKNIERHAGVVKERFHATFLQQKAQKYEPDIRMPETFTRRV